MTDKDVRPPRYRAAKRATAASIALAATATIMVWTHYWNNGRDQAARAPFFLALVGIPCAALLIFAWLLAIPRRDGTVPTARAVGSAVVAALPVVVGVFIFVVALRDH